MAKRKDPTVPVMYRMHESTSKFIAGLKSTKETAMGLPTGALSWGVFFKGLETELVSNPEILNKIKGV